jgi:hypothetical protein
MVRYSLQYYSLLHYCYRQIDAKDAADLVFLIGLAPTGSWVEVMTLHY